MRCDELKELIHLRAVDLLDPDEEAAVRSHLDAGCPRCAAEMAAASGTVSLLPFALPDEEPSPMAKARLMAAVRKEAAAGPAPAGRQAWKLAAAASIVTALVTGLLGGGLVLRHEGRLAARMELLERQVRDAKRSLLLVSSPGVKVVDLVGEGDRAGQAARVFWDRGRESWQLYASNLPAAPAGRTYQLWIITDAGRKISAGTFDTRQEPAAAGSVAVLPEAGRAVLAAVTIEPQGGSEQPTTQPFLVGGI